MTRIELRQIQQHFGLSRKGLAKGLQISERNLKKMELGEFAIPKGLSKAIGTYLETAFPPSHRWAVRNKVPSEWTENPAGWTVYQTFARARKVQHLTGKEIFPVEVRVLITPLPTREVWRILRARKAREELR